MIHDVVQSLRSRTSVAGCPVARATLSDRMAELNVPSVSIAVLDDNGAVLTGAWGATPETLFQAASISKPVAAMAAVRLAAEGVFDLDRNVNELLKSWQLPGGDGVTVRRLLTHSAGLSVHGFGGYEPTAPIPSATAILDGVPPANSEAVRVVRPPGEAFQYSGGGYTVLQLLLEDVSGEPFAALTRRTVLDPLAMTTSTFEQPLPRDRHAVAAAGHDGDGKPITGNWRVHPEQAAAGLWTTPSDLALVAAEMLRPGRVLDETWRDAMITPHVEGGRGLGWGLRTPWFEHGGSNAGFRCLLFGSVAHHRAAVVMTNGDGGNTLSGEVLAAVAEVFGWPDYLEERTAIDLDAETLDAIAGNYEIAPDAVVSVRRLDGRLLSSVPGLPEAELFAASATELFRTDLDAKIVYTADKITITFSGIDIVATRTES